MHEEPECIRAVYKKSSRFAIYRVFPGVMLGHNDVHAKELPHDLFAPILGDRQVMMKVNFSLSGVCEIQGREGEYIYVKGGYMSISRDRSPKVFSYPAGNYEGIELYIFEDSPLSSHPYFDLFGISLEDIMDIYLRHQIVLLTDHWETCLPVVQALHHLVQQDSPDLEQMRLYVLLLLRMLSAREMDLEPVSASALTMRQVNFAKEAEKLLTADLTRRESISEIANQLGVGASSLKNWFRSVFGRSISEYMRELRIQEAKRLLSGSTLSIADISAQVGYENQAKFTAMFHKYCGYTPTAYRKHCITRAGCPPPL